MRIQVPDGASDLLANDIDPDTGTNTGLTASGSTTSAQGGNVTINSNGSFSYDPPAGFEGADTFTYTVTDASGATGTGTITFNVSGMVWFINNNASACTAAGCGRLTNPFSTLAAFNTLNTGVGANNPAAGDNIFIYESATAYTGPATLLSNQKLIGQDSTATLAAITGITLPSFSDPFPAMNTGGNATTINSSTGGINAVNLAPTGTSNTVRGMTITTGNATAGGIVGSSFGTLSVSTDVTISGSGPGLNLTTGTISGDFNSISSTGGAVGIQLNTVAGTSNLGGGTLSGHTTTAFSVNGGTCSITYSGTISQTNNALTVAVSGGHTTGTVTFSGNVSANNGLGLNFNNADGTYNFSGATNTLNGANTGIDIINGSSGTFTFSAGTAISTSSDFSYVESNSTATVNYNGTLTKTTSSAGVNIGNKTGGTTTFSGAVNINSSGATGVELTSNTGGTITFRGGLVVSSGAGTGFNATGGGTINVCATTDCAAGSAVVNTLTSTTGTALNVANTTIGASGLTFRSINKNGNNTAINLNNTGSGAFTVTGNGGTCTTTAASCTGGAIENIVGADAITLNSTGGLVTLSHMLIDNISASTDATDPVGITRSGVDGISGLNVNGGLTLDDTTIRRISDNAILGGTNGVPDVVTTWNGLSIINGSLIELTNRFHVANRGDANNEGTVRILGITGTVTVTDSVFQDGAEFLDLFPITGTLTLNVTNNNFHRGYKEFTSGTTASVGGHCIDVTVQNTANAVVNIGHRTNNALDNDFLNCRLGSIRVANDAGATGNIDVMIGQNEFTSNDHSSGIGGDFDFPQGGVLVMSRGTNTATFDVILDSNYFDEITNASGGVGQFSLDMDGGQWNVIAEENTFDTPGNAPWFIRADNNGNVGTMNSSILFQNNNYLQGFFSCPDVSCGGGYTAPGLRSLVDAQNSANINFTMNGDDLVHHDTGFDPGQTVEVRQLNVPAGGNNGTVCANFLNNTAADGYSFEKFHAVGTFNVEKGASNSGPCANCTDAQIADVLNDNNNKGGGNNPNTVPPLVNVFNTPDGGGAINIVTAACTLPSIPFASLTESNGNFGDSLSFLKPPIQTPFETVASIEPFVEKPEITAAENEEMAETENQALTETKASETVFWNNAATFFAEVSNRFFEAISPTVHSQETEKAETNLSGETITINGSGSGFTIPAGKSLTVTFRATVDNGPFAAGINNITNQATVSGTNFSNVMTNTTSIMLDAAPDLSVTKSDGGATTQPSGTVTYTLNYQNATGNNLQGATGVVLTETVPANTVFNPGASTAGWSCTPNNNAGSTCTFAVGALNAGANGSATFAVNVLGTLPAVSTVSNTSTIADDGTNGTDLNGANNSGSDTTPIIGVWLGGTSTDWFDASNWSNSTIPPSGNNVSVPNVANQPIITTADVTLNNLVLNGENVTLNAGRTLTINGSVMLGGNNIDGAGTLALGSSATISRTTGQVSSALRKTFAATGAFTYPMGTATGYSPLTVNITALGINPSSLQVKANDGTAPATPPLDDAMTLDRYWTLTETGNLTADLTFSYLQADVDGTESNYRTIRVASMTATGLPNGSPCPGAGNPCVDTTANTIFVGGVTDFSDWTAGDFAPVAAQASISGQVLTDSGRGLSRTLVIITGGNLTAPRYAMTNEFGYYRVNDLQVGETYVVTVKTKRFGGREQSSLVTLNEDVSELNFVFGFPDN